MRTNRTRISRERLVVALVWRDMSVTQLADLTGVSRATITSIKSGKSCSQETADKLAAVLGAEIIEKEV